MTASGGADSKVVGPLIETRGGPRRSVDRSTSQAARGGSIVLVLLVAILLVAVACTPQQNPALPIELSIVLAGLATWQLVRRSRAAALAAVAAASPMRLESHAARTISSSESSAQFHFRVGECAASQTVTRRELLKE